MSSIVLTLQGVSKSFGTTHAVRGIDISVQRGEVVALLGPNGSGKSTSLDLALGLLPPDSGKAALFGAPPAEAIDRNLVGVMLQSGSLLTESRVSRILKLFARIAGTTGQLPELLAQTQVTELLSRRIGQLSGGQLQRVRLAIALIGNPELLILDEPTAGLDPSARRHFWDIISQQADSGRTVVFATHHLNEAEIFAPRTVVLNDGVVVADGPTGEVRALAAAQHLTATLDPADWPTLQAKLRPTLAPGDQLAYNRGQLTVTGGDLRASALVVLASHTTRAVELRNSSLDDSFALLTNTTEKIPS